MTGASAVGKKLQEAWLALDVMQCGYCQAGQIMSAAALLNRTPDEGQSPFDLARQSGVTRATMTGLVDGLERDGLVTRDRCPTDRRRQPFCTYLTAVLDGGRLTAVTLHELPGRR